MQFVLFLVVFKIAFTLFIVTLGAMLMAEFFPSLADMAVAAANGTVLEPVGDFVAKGLLFIAKYAQMFVDLVFSWLRAFGIDIDSDAVKDGVKDADFKAPDKVEKPEF